MFQQQCEKQLVIAVADDNPVIAGLVAVTLRRQGYQVLEAHSGAEALKAVESRDGQPLDLLLTDLEMPGINGMALWQSVRAKQPETKVVFMSGSGTPDDVEGAPFLSKPFALAELVGIVEDTLQSSLSSAT